MSVQTWIIYSKPPKTRCGEETEQGRNKKEFLMPPIPLSALRPRSSDINRHTCGPYCPRCHLLGLKHEWFDYHCPDCDLMWYEAERRVVAGRIEVIVAPFI